jgi:hypothetical protein
MTRALLLCCALSTGCLIVPRSQTTSRRVGTEDGIATFAHAREVTLSARAEGTTLYVQATRIGECTQPVFEVSEVTTTKHARLGGASDPRARAFGFLLAPITIPISAIVTGLAVASDTGSTERVTRPLGTKRYACSLQANQLTVALTLPSGAILKETTPRDGHIALAIPDSEPYEGAITVSAPSAPTQQVSYVIPKPAVTAARDAILGCSEQHGVSGNLTAKLSIDEAGQATRVWLSTGDATFNVCVAKAVSSLRFPEATRATTLSLPLTVPAATTATARLTPL